MDALTNLHWAGIIAGVALVLLWLFLRRRPRTVSVPFERQGVFGLKCPVSCLGCGTRVVVYVPHSPDPQKMFGRQVVAEHKCHKCGIQLYTMTGMSGRSILSKGIEFQGDRIIPVQAVQIVLGSESKIEEPHARPTVLTVVKGDDGKPHFLRPE
jgi:hypothetical protein